MSLQELETKARIEREKRQELERMDLRRREEKHRFYFLIIFACFIVFFIFAWFKISTF